MDPSLYSRVTTLVCQQPNYVTQRDQTLAGSHHEKRQNENTLAENHTDTKNDGTLAGSASLHSVIDWTPTAADDHAASNMNELTNHPSDCQARNPYYLHCAAHAVSHDVQLHRADAKANDSGLLRIDPLAGSRDDHVLLAGAHGHQRHCHPNVCALAVHDPMVQPCNELGVQVHRKQKCLLPNGCDAHFRYHYMHARLRSLCPEHQSVQG